MNFFRTLCLTCAVLFASTAFTAQAADKVVTVSIKINESIAADARDAKYGDPLAAALKDGNLGEVVGGGNAVNKAGKIEWAGLDLEVTDVQKSIPVIKQKLLDLGAPKGSTIEYHVGGKRVVVPVQ